MKPRITKSIVAIACLILFTTNSLFAQSTNLTATLNALNNHITGKSSLTANQIETHKLLIDAQAQNFGQSESTIKAAFDLVTTFEKNKSPDWLYRSNLNRKDGIPNDITWTLFNVMQNIVDHIYTPQNIVKHSRLLNGFKFKCANHFPGQVSPPSNPNKPHTIKISASFPKTFGRLEEGFSRKPTTAYLAPGSIATVTVPASLVNKGYNVLVGAHTWDFSRKPRIQRLNRISIAYPITKTQIKVANPLGGGIYIQVPYLADQGIVQVKVQNAVPSPFFSNKPFHKTTLAQWKNTERNRQAPWADFQTEKFMMQVPTNWIYKLDDPITLLNNWDTAIDTMNDLMGLPRIRGKETMYPQIDLMMKAAAYSPGYPSSNFRYNPARDSQGLANHHLIQGPQHAPSFEFHEKGHGFYFVKFPGEVESAVNLPHVAVWHQSFGYTLDHAFRASRERGQANPFKTIDTTAITWMTSLNFANKIPMTDKEKKYQLKGHAKYVDIARLFGWKVIGDFHYSLNLDFENGAEWSRHGSDPDKLSLRFSQSVGHDLTPLLHFWGIHPLNPQALKSAIASANLKPSAKIYDTLLHYQSLIPKDNKAFQTFANNWWAKQPSPNGYETEQSHATQWNQYNQNSATQIKSTIQELIKLYFPNGRPKN